MVFLWIVVVIIAFVAAAAFGATYFSNRNYQTADSTMDILIDVEDKIVNIMSPNYKSAFDKWRQLYSLTDILARDAYQDTAAGAQRTMVISILLLGHRLMRERPKAPTLTLIKKYVSEGLSHPLHMAWCYIVLATHDTPHNIENTANAIEHFNKSEPYAGQVHKKWAIQYMRSYGTNFAFSCLEPSDDRVMAEIKQIESSSMIGHRAFNIWLREAGIY